MAPECSTRFLTDDLDGGHYDAVHRAGHHLDCARTQFKLVTDMEDNWQRMHEIVQEV